MIKFFRKIRYDLIEKNKTGKYLKYAIGEIILVVIGILIALQINNWNQERIQANELDGLMKSISSAMQSDIKYLKLIRTGREDIGLKADSIFNSYIISQKPVFEFNDYAFIANTFGELKNIIYYLPNLSAFEALKNSIYLSKLQGTDIELLLNSFYAAAERLEKKEQDYNQSLNTDYRAWSNKFRNNDGELFMSPWNYLGSGEIQEQFLGILNDEYTKSLLANSFEELDMLDLYDQQIILGEKYIEMVEKREMNFDTQTKIDFSGAFYSYAEVDVLNLLVNGKIPSDFGVIYAQSSNEYYTGIKFEDDAMIVSYPENTFDWGSSYFTIDALNNRVKEMDFTKYKNVTLEMKGAIGGEQFFVTIKDKYDPPDGSESRADITVTNTWETYEVSVDHFKTADKKIIEIPMAFVFIGDQGRTIHVRSIQFK
jgi:hypothetical protein